MFMEIRKFIKRGSSFINRVGGNFPGGVFPAGIFPGGIFPSTAWIRSENLLFQKSKLLKIYREKA